MVEGLSMSVLFLGSAVAQKVSYAVGVRGLPRSSQAGIKSDLAFREVVRRRNGQDLDPPTTL